MAGLTNSELIQFLMYSSKSSIHTYIDPSSSITGQLEIHFVSGLLARHV